MLFYTVFVCIHRANWVRVNGTKYQKPCGLLVGRVDDVFKFGKVVDIFVNGKEVLFEVELLNTLDYLLHYHTFCLSPIVPSESQTYYVKHSQLLDYHPYGLYHSALSTNPSFLYLIMRYNVYV